MRIRTVVVLAIVSTIACAQAKQPPRVVAATRPPKIAATECLADMLPALSYAWTRRPQCTVDENRCLADCKAGDASSCFERALHEQSIDMTRGGGLFVRACLLGLSIACVNHAAGLWAHPKTRADLTCARRIFEKSCAVNDSMGCGMVGRMMVEEATTEQTRADARSYLERLCNELEGPPCRMLAFYLESGKLGAFEPALLQELMAKACAGGDAGACGDHATVGETFTPKP